MEAGGAPRRYPSPGQPPSEKTVCPSPQIRFAQSCRSSPIQLSHLFPERNTVDHPVAARLNPGSLMMTRIKSMLLPVIAVLLLTACSTTSHVLVGKKRAATSPENVKVYLQPPAKFEQIALLDADSQWSFRFSPQGQMDATLARIKKEAAKLGANGVLLEGVGTEYINTGTISSGTATFNGDGPTASDYGSSFSGSAPIKVARGIAIYVLQE